MANWICVYTIVMSPFLVAVGTFAGQNVFSPIFPKDSVFSVFDIGLHVWATLIGLGITAAMLVGGIRLRNLRRSGASIITVAIWIGIGNVVLINLSVFAVGLIALQSGAQLIYKTSPTTPQQLTDFVFLIVALAGWTFEIITLVWLHRNAKHLPLR